MVCGREGCAAAEVMSDAETLTNHVQELRCTSRVDVRMLWKKQRHLTTPRKAGRLSRTFPVRLGELHLTITSTKPCDVTSKKELETLYDEIVSKEKYLNLLICAAGISGAKAEPKDEEATSLKERLWNNETFEVWNETYNTDVTSVYFTTVALLPLLQAGTESHGHLSASVIVISSMSGIMRDSQGHFSYNAAKGGTVHLTKLMSAEFQKVRIRVNSIAPGYFPSEMTAKESDDRMKSQLPDEKIQEKGHVPMGRAGSDEEMAQAVLFLTKCAYVNGEILAVDGGVLNVVSGR
jgi:NAD(P)-dependent dehydrogenase (short-subunit alcohol dehydrogenase family)